MKLLKMLKIDWNTLREKIYGKESKWNHREKKKTEEKIDDKLNSQPNEGEEEQPKTAQSIKG